MGLLSGFNVTLPEIEILGQAARAAFSGAAIPNGWSVLTPQQLGLAPQYWDGLYFTDNGASAIVLQQGNSIIVSFRGTDSTADSFYYPELLFGTYINRFQPLLTAIAAQAPGDTHFYFTGTSLGGGAVNQMADIASYESAGVFVGRDVRHLIDGAATKARSSKIKMRIARRLRRNRCEQGLKPIYICTEQQFRIIERICCAVRTPERYYDRIALLQDDGACTVVREVKSIPVLRSQPELLWGQHAPAIRDRSPAERGSCRLTQYFDFRERDVEATEQAHERLLLRSVYCVSAVLRVPTTAGRLILNSVHLNGVPGNDWRSSFRTTRAHARVLQKQAHHSLVVRNPADRLSHSGRFPQTQFAPGRPLCSRRAPGTCRISRWGAGDRFGPPRRTEP